MHSWLKWMGTSVLLAGVVGCTQPATPENTESLSISPVSKTIDDKGGTTRLRVSATDPSGKEGTGEVTVTTSVGFLDGNQRSVTLSLSGGTAATDFSCPVARDNACKGSVRIEGTWGGLTGSTTIQVSATATPGDGGSTPPTTPDAGTGDGGVVSPPPVTEVGKPANIIFDTEGGTATELGIRSVGLRTATPVTFTVLDIQGKPVPDADVTFTVDGPAGMVLVPTTQKTGATGKASTVLQSGDEVGVATVFGSIGFQGGSSLKANTPGIAIIGARVSDRGLVVQCKQLILSALSSPNLPNRDPTTQCTVDLTDRFPNPIKAKTTVTWYSEAGSVGSPVQTVEGTGTATTTFGTTGVFPPVAVDPITSATPGYSEPKTVADGVTRNPRDMLVTVIAVTAGEEDFYDGSGLSTEKNGQWDKGEWFVDVPEPFVDANDNQVYDSGEFFIDTERTNCATGVREPKNGKWDGPNGCWDGNTMLWRPTHILYSGYNSLYPFSLTYYPAQTQPARPPVSVSKDAIADVPFIFRDAFMNPISPDRASFGVSTAGSPGTAELNSAEPPTNNDIGFQIFYELVEVETDSSARGYHSVGPCNYLKKPAPGASTDARLARCAWQYRFGKFDVHTNSGVLRLKGGAPGSPNGTLTVTLSLGNTYIRLFDSFDVKM